MIAKLIIEWFVKLMISNWRKARFIRNNYDELSKRKCKSCGAPVIPEVGKEYITLNCTKKCGEFGWLIYLKEEK